MDSKYYKNKSIVIEREKNKDGKINTIELDGKTLNSFFISHDDFVNGKTLKVIQN
ncbi:MAG: glycoside hydrolase domain-containing protein [Flavobacterium sp.]